MESKKGSKKVQLLNINDSISHTLTPEIKEKKPEEIRVLFGIPRGGFGMPEAADNREDIKYHLGKVAALTPTNFYCVTFGRVVVHLSRDNFAKCALQHDCDYLFMLDDDMIFPIDIFEQLYNRIIENKEVDICAALAFQRREPYYPVIYKQNVGFDAARREEYFANEVVRNYPKNTLFECDAVGFGAVLIKTDVIKVLNEPYFLSTCPSGEDVLFCYNARRAGFRVFVDTACKTTHLGAPTLIDEEYYEKFNAINRDYLGEAK